MYDKWSNRGIKSCLNGTFIDQIAQPLNSDGPVGISEGKSRNLSK